MNLFFILFSLSRLSRFRKPVPVLGSCFTPFRCLPTDLDVPEHIQIGRKATKRCKAGPEYWNWLAKPREATDPQESEKQIHGHSPGGCVEPLACLLRAADWNQSAVDRLGLRRGEKQDNF